MKKIIVMLGLSLAAFVLGCGGGVKQETIEVKPGDPMDQVKTTLERYAKGEPMTSEVTSFEYMVNQVKAKDPAKADILEKGLEDLKKAPKGQLAGKAKDLMSKLGIK